MFLKYISGWHRIYNFCGLKIKAQVIKRHYDTLNLIFDSKEGIGNRIFGLVNYIYFSNPKRVNIYWNNEGWVSKKFCEIFDYNPDFIFTEYNDLSITKKWKNSKNEITINFPPAILRTFEGEEIDLQSVTAEKFSLYSKEFRKIKPSEVVKNRIHSTNLPDNYVALQVRNSEDWESYGRNEALTDFYKEIDKYPKDTVFYLSAMNSEVSQAFKNRYGSRIFELPNKDYNSMTDSISDLFIMSYADEGLYSYGSTFGVLAFWLSDNLQKVNIIGNGNGWKLQKGFEVRNIDIK